MTAIMTRQEYVTGEFEHLYGTDGIERIAYRLGYLTPYSLQHALVRWGEFELAHLVHDEIARQRGE
jgi:hypothetical protein